MSFPILPEEGFSNDASEIMGRTLCRNKIDLDNEFSFGGNHKGHSAQFRSTVQKRWSYWTGFLADIEINIATP